jgi:hypothetical protein
MSLINIGYLGVEKDFPDQLSSLPHRKKRIMELLQEEIENNKSHSKQRITIEHTICRLKKYRILADIFRNRLKKHTKASNIVSCLVNYRIINQIQ